MKIPYCFNVQYSTRRKSCEPLLFSSHLRGFRSICTFFLRTALLRHATGASTLCGIQGNVTAPLNVGGRPPRKFKFYPPDECLYPGKSGANFYVKGFKPVLTFYGDKANAALGDGVQVNAHPPNQPPPHPADPPGFVNPAGAPDGTVHTASTSGGQISSPPTYFAAEWANGVGGGMGYGAEVISPDNELPDVWGAISGSNPHAQSAGGELEGAMQPAIPRMAGRMTGGQHGGGIRARDAKGEHPGGGRQPKLPRRGGETG